MDRFPEGLYPEHGCAHWQFWQQICDFHFPGHIRLDSSTYLRWEENPRAFLERTRWNAQES